MSKIAVVTGAGSGIGRAAALALSEDGWTVVLAGRRVDALDETAAAAKSPTLSVPTDVADPVAVDRLFAQAVEAFGRVDLLFNNAGMGAPSLDLDELPVETIRQLLDVNLFGSFLCARAAFGIMRWQDPMGGRIINNGSIAAHSPRPRSAPYTASKHAITGLTKSLALDGRPYRIAAGQIDIGNAVTALSTPMAVGVPQADGRIVPEPRLEIEHVARAVAHMASLPLDANIPFMTIMATNMPLFGRG